jgi:uncharacterized Zn-binding protein involved in type VI secretion
MPPAARVSDLQVSPGNSGPLGVGSANVRIGGMPAARAGDPTGSGGVIASGSPTVFIGGKPAARVGDRASGGGLLLTGVGNVLIGDRAGVGALEPIGGGASAGTDTRSEKEKKKDKEKEEKAKKEEEKKAKEEQKQKDKAAKEAEGAEGDGDGLSLLGSPATAELVGAFLKMAEGLFKQLAGVLPPGIRDMLSTSLGQAQQALAKMQIGPLNQSVAQLQTALQQASGVVPPEQMAAAAQAAAKGAAAPGGVAGAAEAGAVAAVDPAGAVGPRLSVGEGSVLDDLRTPTIPIVPGIKTDKKKN